MKRILITGSRDLSDYEVVASALSKTVVADSVVVHGDCPTGADALAEKWCNSNGVHTEKHPAQWAELGKRAGPVRNIQMVELGAAVCLAFPRGESRGTRHCMRIASEAGIEVLEY